MGSGNTFQDEEMQDQKPFGDLKEQELQENLCNWVVRRDLTESGKNL